MGRDERGEMRDGELILFVMEGSGSYRGRGEGWGVIIGVRGSCDWKEQWAER